MITSVGYSGYLAPYVETIRALHERGASTRAIAEALYDAGARAHTSGCDPVEMSRAAHIVNLRAMVIHIQRRLGLRVRRVRLLNLKATTKNETPGYRPSASLFQNADDDSTDA